MTSKILVAAAALAATLGISNPADARPRDPGPEFGIAIGVGGVKIDVHTGFPIVAPHRVWIPGHYEKHRHHRKVWVPGHYDIR